MKINFYVLGKLEGVYETDGTTETYTLEPGIEKSYWTTLTKLPVGPVYIRRRMYKARGVENLEGLKSGDEFSYDNHGRLNFLVQ
jgi:hypothetical protein